MLTAMEVDSAQPDVSALPLGGFTPNTELIQIRNIEGLGPVKAEIASTPFATARGELYQGASTPKRNIVLTLGLNPNVWASNTLTTLRQSLYAYFMPEEWVTLRFVSDELPTVAIRGIVESFEPNIFSQDPEIQISILCPKPDFIDIETTVLSGEVDDGTLETGILYQGTVPDGFELKIELAEGTYTGDLVILNKVRGLEQRFKLQAVTVDPTMYVDLNTVRAARYVYSLAESDDSGIDILSKVDVNPVWPELLPGTNIFTVAADTVDTGLTWTMAYFRRYGGL